MTNFARELAFLALGRGSGGFCSRRMLCRQRRRGKNQANSKANSQERHKYSADCVVHTV